MAHARVIVNNYPLRDINVHSYRTDPNYFSIVQIGNEIEPVMAYAVFIYNTTNQNISVQTIVNVDATQTYPDILFGGAYTVNSSGGDGWFVQDFQSYPVEYISYQVSASVAPTTGYVFVELFIYRG
jgi:hypothetical protein